MGKLKTAVLFGFCMLFSIQSICLCHAELTTYKEQAGLYGDRYKQYVYKVPTTTEETKEIEVTGIKGTTFTETHIRTQPDAESQYAVIIPTGTTVTIYGVTKNGWYRVLYTPSEEGAEAMYGYIRADLLQ